MHPHMADGRPAVRVCFCVEKWPSYDSTVERVAIETFRADGEELRVPMDFAGADKWFIETFLPTENTFCYKLTLYNPFKPEHVFRPVIGPGTTTCREAEMRVLHVGAVPFKVELMYGRPGEVVTVSRSTITAGGNSASLFEPLKLWQTAPWEDQHGWNLRGPEAPLHQDYFHTVETTVVNGHVFASIKPPAIQARLVTARLSRLLSHVYLSAEGKVPTEIHGNHQVNVIAHVVTSEHMSNGWRHLESGDGHHNIMAPGFKINTTEMEKAAKNKILTTRNGEKRSQLGLSRVRLVYVYIGIGLGLAGVAIWCSR